MRVGMVVAYVDLRTNQKRIILFFLNYNDYLIFFVLKNTKVEGKPINF